MIFPLLGHFSEAKAGFCWDLNASGSCTVQSQNGTDLRPDQVVGVIEKDERLVVPSEFFRFRSDCHSPASGCDGQDWEVSFIDFQYQFNGAEAVVSYRLDALFNFDDGNESRNNWKLGNKKLDGDADDLYSDGMSGNIQLVLVLNKNRVRNLDPGTHRYTFVIRGEDVQDTSVYRDLHYTFSFIVPDDKQVQITGLKPMPLGSFPEYSRRSDQTFCVHATSDQAFSLMASSNFLLEAPEGSIEYRASLLTKPQGSNTFSGEFLVVDGQRYNQNGNGVTLTGERSAGLWWNR